MTNPHLTIKFREAAPGVRPDFAGTDLMLAELQFGDARITREQLRDGRYKRSDELTESVACFVRLCIQHAGYLKGPDFIDDDAAGINEGIRGDSPRRVKNHLRWMWQWLLEHSGPKGMEFLHQLVEAVDSNGVKLNISADNISVLIGTERISPFEQRRCAQRVMSPQIRSRLSNALDYAAELDQHRKDSAAAADLVLVILKTIDEADPAWMLVVGLAGKYLSNCYRNDPERNRAAVRLLEPAIRNAEESGKMPPAAYRAKYQLGLAYRRDCRFNDATREWSELRDCGVRIRKDLRASAIEQLGTLVIERAKHSKWRPTLSEIEDGLGLLKEAFEAFRELHDIRRMAYIKRRAGDLLEIKAEIAGEGGKLAEPRKQDWLQAIAEWRQAAAWLFFLGRLRDAKETEERIAGRAGTFGVSLVWFASDDLIGWVAQNIQALSADERGLLHATVANLTHPFARSVQSEIAAARTLTRLEHLKKDLASAIGSTAPLDVTLHGHAEGPLLVSEWSAELREFRKRLQGGKDVIKRDEDDRRDRVFDEMTAWLTKRSSPTIAICKRSTEMGEPDGTAAVTVGVPTHELVDTNKTVGIDHVQLVFYRDRRLADAVVSDPLPFAAAEAELQERIGRFIDVAAEQVSSLPAPLWKSAIPEVAPVAYL